MSGVKTQLTKLYYRTGTSGSYALVAIPSVTAIPIATPTAPNIDVTDVDNGAFTLTLNHISFGQSGAAAYETFISQAIGASTTYVVAMSDGTVAPTIHLTTGVITYDSGRSHRTFTGIFAGAGDTFNVDDAVRATATITISGAITRTAKSA
jgi:hypothetical protein